MSVKSVNQVKEVNIYLNDKFRFESTAKTMAILSGSDAEIIWVKHKNTLTGNNDSVLALNRRNKTINVIKKYATAVRRNDALTELVDFWVQLGFQSTV